MKLLKVLILLSVVLMFVKADIIVDAKTTAEITCVNLVNMYNKKFKDYRNTAEEYGDTFTTRKMLRNLLILKPKVDKCQEVLKPLVEKATKKE